MDEVFYTAKTGWTEAGIAEQERRRKMENDLTKLTADDLLEMEPQPEQRDEIRRRLERMEKCETELETVKNERRGLLGLVRARLEQSLPGTRLHLLDLADAVGKRLEKCEAAILVADMYILKLRQAWYGNPDKPSVRENAVAQLNACGSAWTAARAALEGK